MTYHKDDEIRPSFNFSVINSFKDCLSRQVAEAIRIHYATDELLNSKNEYNANHLSRVIVDEDAYTRKKREKMEEVAELEEKRKWEEFKKEKRTQPKRQRVKEDESLPYGWKEPQHKKLRRMETEVEEDDTLDLSDWWLLVEGICGRAGILKRTLVKDKERFLRRMEVTKNGGNNC